MSKPLHLSQHDARELYHALRAPTREHDYPDDREKARRMEAIDTYLDWWGKTLGSHGLTAEKDTDFEARNLGVRVTVDGGAIVIRVPKGARR